MPGQTTGATLAQLMKRRRQKTGGLNLTYGSGNFTMRGTPRGQYRPRSGGMKAPTQDVRRLSNRAYPRLNSVGQVKLAGSQKLNMGSNLPRMGGM